MKKWNRWHIRKVFFVVLSLLVSTTYAEDDEIELPVNRSIKKGDFYLISGMEIAQTNKTPGKVVGVERNTLLVRTSGNGRIQKVPSDSLEDMKINRDLTLSPTFIEIDRLVAEKTFTPKNDPQRKWAKSTQTAMFLNSYFADQAYLKEQEYRMAEKPAVGPALSPEAAEKMRQDQGKYEAIERQAFEATRLANEGMMSRASMREAAQVNPTGYDALKVSFQATPSRPMKNVYAILVAEYREETEPITARRTWIQFSEVGDLEPKLTLLRIRGGGLPPGYVLLNAKVHLYENGVEIATNASDNCVPLTWRDALQYLQLAHLSAHKADTVSASIAKTLIPKRFASDVPPAEQKRRVRVSIDEKGTPIDFAPVDGNGPLSNLHLSYLRQIGFLPAVEKGKPIAGSLELSLADLHASGS